MMNHQLFMIKLGVVYEQLDLSLYQQQLTAASISMHDQAGHPGNQVGGTGVGCPAQRVPQR